MKRALAAFLALSASCGGGSEEDAAKDRAAAMATWALVFKLDGAEVKVPLKAMNVLLFKDEEYAAKNTTVFHVEGDGVHLYGEIPPANQPGYGEDWQKMIGATLAVKASGEFFHEMIESSITPAGKPELKISGGTMTVESRSGKWSGQNGDKALKGKFSFTLSDGRKIEGTWAVHAFTWG